MWISGGKEGNRWRLGKTREFLGIRGEREGRRWGLGKKKGMDVDYGEKGQV